MRLIDDHGQCRYWDSESNFCTLYRPASTKHGHLERVIRDIKVIINIPNTVIQEDVLKYKMICDVIARMDED